MPQEKRQFERLEIFLIVDINPSGDESNYYLGLTKNISLGGFSFESQNYDFNAGDLMEFKIKDPEGNLHVSVAGKIAWTKRTDFECLVGVKFYGLDEDTRNRIAALIPEGRELPEENIVDDKKEEVIVSKIVPGPDVEREEGVISDSIIRVSDIKDNKEDEKVDIEIPEQAAVVAGESSQSNEVMDEPDDAEIVLEAQEEQIEEQPEVEQEVEPEVAQVRPETGRRYGKVIAIAAAAAITVAVLLNLETKNDNLLDPKTETPLTASFKHESGIDEKPPLQEAVPALHEIPEPEPTDIVLAEVPGEAVVEGGGVEDEFSVGPDLMEESDNDIPEVTADISQKSEKEILSNAPEEKKDVLRKSILKPVKEKPLKLKPDVKMAEKKTAVAAPTVDHAKAAEEKTVVVSSGTAKEEKKTIKSKPVLKAESKPAQVADTKPEVKSPAAPAKQVSLLTKKSPEDNKAASSDKSVDKDSVQDRPLPDKYIIYEENFSNNLNKWSIFNTHSASARIEDGEYFLQNKREKGSHIVYHYHDFPHDNDFLIEAAIRTVRAPGGHSYGFIFGGRDTLNYYAFQIDNNHSFAIRKYINGVPDELAAGTVKNIYENLHNILRIAKQGDNVRFFVNGKYLAKVNDLSFVGSKIGFISNGKSEISIDRTYSRIKIEQ